MVKVRRLLGSLALTTALGAGLAALGCRSLEPPPKPPALREWPLAARLAQAELRSDGFDLAFVVERRLLLWPGWQSPKREAGALTVLAQRRDAETRLPFFSRAAKTLTLRAQCLPPLRRLGVAVLLNGKAAGHFETTAAAAEFRVPLPEALQVEGDNTLTLRLDRAPAKGEAPLALTQLSVSGGDGIATPSADGGALLVPPHASAGFALPARAGLAHEARVAAGRLAVRYETDAGATTLSESVPAGTVRLALPPATGYARLVLANPGTTPLRIEAPAIVGLPALPAALPAAALGGHPSVVIFLTDTLRADRLGAYGYEQPTSPAFDAFARESILFEDAWAHAPWTRPTVASIFTGLHPSTHGAGGFDRALGGGFTTLAEYFRKAGYRTGAVVSNHVVSQRFGFAQGFDVWNDGEKRRYGFSAKEAVERALRFVDAGPQPFFLYVHTMEPHVPYEPSDEDWAPFHAKGVARRPSLPILMKPKGPAEIAYLETLYLGEILGNDHAFGSLIDALRARGRLDDTLVAFVADHGEEFGDHGGHGHGHTLYRELTRVPLAVRLPKAARGGVREMQPVAQVDLLPTLLSLASLAAPELREGRDLSSLFLGRGAPGEAPELVSETRFGKADKSALRIGSLKLIVNDDPRVYGELDGPVELYDLDRDPGEHENRAAREPIAVQYLRARLEELRASQKRAAELLHGGAKVELSDEDRNELRALGYVQ